MKMVNEVATAVQTSIAGERAVCDPSGALFLPAASVVVISDLHLEKGSAYARRGTFLPPYDTAKTLKRLQNVIARFRPRSVISLGDSFHDRQGSSRLPSVFRAHLEALMRGREWFWIAGNHDPDPPEALPGNWVSELALGELVFRHEPKNGAEGEIAGHLHPGARIVQRGQSVRRPCFACDGKRLIMPAFGSLTGSLNVLDRAFSQLLCRDALVAYMLGSNRVYPIASSQLRPA